MSKRPRENVYCSRFRKGRVVGQGTFSRVFRAICDDTEQETNLVIKEFDTDDPDLTSAQIELTALIALKRLPHTMQLEDYQPRDVLEMSKIDKDSPPSIALILPAMDMTLRDLVAQFSELADSEAALSRCIRQIVVGVRSVHSKDIVHRDVKPENILASVQEIDNKVFQQSC
jgi:serine/threonine protein kinase